MSLKLYLAAALMLIIFSGCTIMDGGSIVTGNVKNPTQAESVRIYRTPPAKFEEIGVVSASAGHDFEQNSSLLNAAINRLKVEAAKLGANGILLTKINERDTPVVTTSYGTAVISDYDSSISATGNSISVNRGDAHTRVQGVAIYVP